MLKNYGCPTNADCLKFARNMTDPVKFYSSDCCLKSQYIRNGLNSETNHGHFHLCGLRHFRSKQMSLSNHPYHDHLLASCLGDVHLNVYI